MADQSPAPELYGAIANEDGSVDLTFGGSWESWPDLNIQRRIVGTSTWYTIDTVLPYDTAWTDLDADMDTEYQYRVKPTGFIASNSDTVWTYPGDVTGLTAEAVANEGSVNLSWTNEPYGYSAYSQTKIYYKKSSASTWTTALIAISVSAVVEGLEEGVDYDFKVSILGGGSVEGGISNTVSGVTTNIPKPSGLEGSSIDADTIRLTWVDNSDYEDGFEIYRDGVLLGTVAAEAETYDDNTVSLGTTYTYKVRAYVGAEVSDWSDEVDILAGVAPSTPTLNSVTASDIDQITIAFTPDGITSNVDVYVSEDDVTYELHSSILNTQSPYNITGLTSNTLYYVKVRARNAAGSSALTASQSDTTDSDLRPPTDLSATMLSDTQITLTWTHLGVDRTYYKLERMITGGAWVTVDDEIDPDTEEYIDGGLRPATEYTYRLSILFGAEEGTPSSTSTTTTDTAGTAPTKMDSLFAMGKTLCQMSDGLQGVRNITRRWYSKEFDFSDLDPANFHHWKFIDKVMLEYEDVETDCPITIGVSKDHGTTWETRTINVGDNTGKGRIRDFRFVPISGIYFQVYVECTDREKDLPWTGLYVGFDQGGEHYDTGYLD